jgi:hypothetical protein
LGGRAAVGVAIAAVLGGAAACGDGFGGGSDCKASRTCAPDDTSGGTEADGSGGSPDPSPINPGGGAAPGGSSGAVDTEQTPECTTAADCDNADPTDGQEICFNGRCAPGNAPPTIVSVSPENAAVAVEPDGSVVIELSEALDGATVTSNNVRLLDGDEPVPGKLSYSNGKITFVPDKALALLASYEISLSTSVTDAAGAGLAEAFSSTFSVRDGAWSVTTVVPGMITEMSPQIQLNADGDALVAWIGEGNGSCPTTAAWYNRGALKGSLRTFSHGGTVYCRSINAAVSANGFALLSWFEEKSSGQDVATVEFRAGKWGPATARSQRFDELGVVAAAEDGTMHYFGSSSPDTQVWHTTSAGAWSKTGKPVGPQAQWSRPNVAVAQTGDAVVAWRIQESSGEVRILVSSYSHESATWSTGVTLPGSSTTDETVVHGEPQVAFDDANEPLILWSRDGELVANRYARPQGTWGGPVAVTTGTLRVPTLPYAAEPPALVFDGQTFVAAFSGSAGSKISHTYVVRYDRAEETWGLPEIVSDAGSHGTPRMPRLTADSRGNLLVVWASLESPGVYGLVAQRFNARAFEWSGPSPIVGATIDSLELRNGEGRYALGGNQSGLAALTFADMPTGAEGSNLRLASFY